MCCFESYVYFYVGGLGKISGVLQNLMGRAIIILPRSQGSEGYK
jgi:hypothetical protein